MVIKSLILGLTFLIISALSYGQGELSSVLESVGKNNKTIISAIQYTEARTIQLHTGLTPDDPFVAFDYMIGRPISGGNQLDLEIIQAFDFPTVYRRKRELAANQSKLLEIGFVELKQEVLMEAKLLCIELTYLNKQKLILQERIHMADSNYSKLKKKFDLDEIDGLEFSKAKIHLLGIKTQFRSIQNQIITKTDHLIELNGGELIEYNNTDYPLEPVVPEFSILVDSIDANDPSLVWINQQTTILEAQVEVNKALRLPRFEAGYHYQTVLGQTFNGAQIGLSIPLWQNKNKVKASEALALQNKYRTEEHTTEHYHHFKELYNNYTSLKQTIADYKEVLTSINSREILDSSLKHGSIDFIRYAMELEYFYSAEDNLLINEKEYQLVLVKLFKYQL